MARPKTSPKMVSPPKFTNTDSKMELEILLLSDFLVKYKSAVISAADLCNVKKLIRNLPE